MAVIWNFYAMSGSQQRRCQITKFPDPPPPPSTPSPHLNCTSHNSANWPGISSRTITVITGLCQAPKPKVVSLGGVGEFLLFPRLG